MTPSKIAEERETRIRRTPQSDAQCSLGRHPHGRVVRQCAAQLTPRADVELREDLAQVVLDRARADEQLRTDLGIRAAIGGPRRGAPPARSAPLGGGGGGAARRWGEPRSRRWPEARDELVRQTPRPRRDRTS